MFLSLLGRPSTHHSRTFFFCFFGVRLRLLMCLVYCAGRGYNKIKVGSRNVYSPVWILFGPSYLFSFQTFNGRIYLILKFVIRFIENRGRGKTPDDEITAKAHCSRNGQLMFARPVLILCSRILMQTIRMKKKKILKDFWEKRIKNGPKKNLFLSAVVVWPPLEISQTGKMKKKKKEKMFFSWPSRIASSFRFFTISRDFLRWKNSVSLVSKHRRRLLHSPVMCCCCCCNAGRV